jgi:molybdopterin/thiamine biosynthesis adenylyltransferase
MSSLLHEQLARRPEAMQRLADTPITLCGAGALGANLAESLARAGCGRLKVLDKDRIEEHNLSTQPWQRGDIHQHKAKILGNTLYRAVGAKVDAQVVEVDEHNAEKLLVGSGLVVDCFDNRAARLCVQHAARALGLPCVHGGLSGDGYGEVVWDEDYTVPSDPVPDPDRPDAVACDYPLARNLVMLTASMLAEVVISFIADDVRRAFAVTLGDLTISRLR